MSLKLYVFPPSPRSFKVLTAASHLDLGYEKCVVDLQKGEQRHPEFASINPNRKLPVLEDGAFRLWESNAILQYLASKRPDSGLLPSDPQRRAQVAQWQFWDLAHWEPACVKLVFERFIKPLFGMGEPDPSEVERGLAAFAGVAPVLDDRLGDSRFLAGPELTIADFSVGAILNLADAVGFPVDEYPNIGRWHEALTELPGWRHAMVRLPMPASNR
jgi:glutathione S-transferase